MPSPSQPPFEAGALLQPRQLQRWLDVNKVSKLTRTQTYWVLPAFSVDNDWLGYSDIVAVFNFTATNNFSLPLDYDVPLSPSFCPCIMWVDEDDNVYRYKLWEDVGEVMYFNCPLYTGQVIKKNFRIEIWNVLPTSYTQFTMNGGGLIAVNQTFEYAGGNLWNGTGDDPGYYITPVTGIYGLFNPSDDGLYLLTEGDVFPTGLWYAVGGSAAPPPYASISTTATLADAINFSTSVAGQYDYMWANDSAMATASAIVTDFSVNLTGLSVFDLPMVWPADSVPTPN